MSHYLSQILETETAIYAWTITRDYISAGAPTGGACGITGPAERTAEVEALLESGPWQHFSLFDDDGERYYRGRAVWTPGTDLETAGAGPLFDFGEGYAGCTSIEWDGHPELNV